MAETTGYRAVIDWIRNEIKAGNLKKGDRLPSEKDLCDQFGLSRQTVRHATGELEKEGILNRVRGSGTYVGGNEPVLRQAKYRNVAVVSTYVDSYIFPPTIRGIESVLARAGYSVQLSFTDDLVSRERTALQNLLDKDNIDGLIIEPSKSALPNPNLDLYRQLSDRKVPILFFNAEYRDLHLPCIRIDDVQAGRSATEVLIRAGHRKLFAILHLEDEQGRLRYQGFTEAVSAAELPLDDHGFFWLDSLQCRDLGRTADALFDRLKGHTGVLCYNDEVAFQLIQLAMKRGIRIPRDLSVVSIDNSDLAVISPVPITSCLHPKEKLGIKAAENLLKMIEDPSFDGSCLFPSTPCVRDSVINLY